MGAEERDSGSSWNAPMLDRMTQSQDVDREEMVCMSIWGYCLRRLSTRMPCVEEDE